MAVSHSWYEPRTKEENTLLQLLRRVLWPLLILEIAAVRIVYLWVIHRRINQEMKLSIVKLVGVATLSILGLVLIAWMFELAGAKIGWIRKQSSYLLFAGGTVVIFALNSGLLHNQWLGRSLSGLNLAYFVAFLPFCYGMWNQATA
jgi:hypothetical protein